MGIRPQTNTSELVVLAETTGRLIAPDSILAKVENLVPTTDGGLRSAYSPLPYQTTGGGAEPNNGTAVAATPVYDTTRGVFHCLLQGGARDVLLLHTGAEIWVHDGSVGGWRVLVGPSASSPDYVASLPNTLAPQFPTQFVSTPTGVVIIPQGGHAMFYDGYTVGPLGYSRSPSPPIGLGPESSKGAYTPLNADGFPGVNDVRYALDALDSRPTAMHEIFKRGRVGTVVTFGIPATDPNDLGQVLGYLEPGRWRCRVQWIDQWGNLSPISGPSNDVVFERQPATGFNPGGPTSKWVSVDKVLKQVAWDGINPGPAGTIGRILYRTKDLVNSGTAEWWELPINSTTVVNTFATLPDNVTNMYPDNIPDAWLSSVAVEVAPVPEFKLAAVAFGRLWIANTIDQPGLIRPSLVGRWGTFPVGLESTPDPSGAEITGIHTVTGGLIVTTETSTFLITQNENGEFNQRTVSSTKGCSAPSSVVTMENGVTMWLSRDGFVAFDGTDVQPLWTERERETRALTASRLKAAVACYDPRRRQYRCWLAADGTGSNSRCWCFDGNSWHEESIVAASGVCVTKDHRRMVVACGLKLVAIGTPKDGVWVMDHGDTSYKTAVAKTGWIRGLSSRSRASILRVRFWMRESRMTNETGSKNITLAVRKNWRADIVDTQYIPTHMDVSPAVQDDPPPSFYSDDTLWGDAVVRRRRPFWYSADVHIPACETFQLEVTQAQAGKFEVIGFAFDWQDVDDAGARAR